MSLRACHVFRNFPCSLNFGGGGGGTETVNSHIKESAKEKKNRKSKT